MGIVSTTSHSILSFDSVHLFLVSSIILSSKPHICLHEIMLTLLTPVVFRSFFIMNIDRLSFVVFKQYLKGNQLQQLLNIHNFPYKYVTKYNPNIIF